MRINDLVKLAKWCKNGPELMQIVDINYQYIVALFLGGPELGSIVNVSKGNVFALEKYDEAMRRHYERR